MKTIHMYRNVHLGKLSLVMVVAVAFFAAAMLLRSESAVHALEGSSPVGAGLGDSVMTTGFAEVIEAVSPAVVSLAVSKRIPASDIRMEQWGSTPFQNWRFDGPGQLPEWFWNFVPRPEMKKNQRKFPRQFSGVGAGVVFDPEGLIATNYHVIEDAEEISVTLHDGRKLEAEVVGIDNLTDLAVLRVETDEQIPYAEFGDTENVRVGDWAIAIGDPFGLSKSVSLGIVSAMGRNLLDNSPGVPLLQVDAAVNRGNSGGPLFNSNGQVIGINTMIVSPTGASAGVGFAVPSSLVEDVVYEIQDKGRVSRGWLGVGIQNVTPEIAGALNMDDENPYGALVSSVEPDSTAENAGIAVGDIVLEFNNKRIEGIRALSAIVKKTDPGSDVSIVVLRDGEKVTLHGRLDALDSGAPDTIVASARADAHSPLGVVVQALTPDLRKQFQVAERVEGVVITEVMPESPAAIAGLKKGDIIVSINNNAVKSTEQARDAMQSVAESGNTSALLLVADGKGEQLFVVVALS